MKNRLSARRRLTFLSAIVALNLLPAAPTAFSALDPSFGIDGKVVTTLPGVTERAFAIGRQVDGKLVVAGSASDDFLIARYNADGSLDGSFGTNGLVLTDFGNFDTAHALALQADGRIVVAGVTSGNFALARYNADGSPDSSFDGDGKLTTDFGGTDEANAVVIQVDGKIVVAGGADGGSFFAVARYNPDGSLDTSFDGDGRATTKVHAVADQRAMAVALQLDGKIIAAGRVGAGGVKNMGVARYNIDGSLDPSFGNNGTVHFDSVNGVNSSHNVAFAQAVALQADGKIILTGEGNEDLNLNAPDTFLIARLNANGSLDSGTGNDATPGDSFGTNGFVHPDLSSGSDIANAVTLQPDGKIVAVGSVDAGHVRGATGVVRFNADGTPDTSFGAGGKVTVPFNDLIPSFIAHGPDSVLTAARAARGVVLQPDGKIVTAGSGNFPGTGGDLMLTRLNANGSLDATFGGGGKVRTDFGLPGAETPAHAVAVRSDGKMMSVTRRTPNLDGQFELLCYDARGELHLPFGSGGRAALAFSDAGGFLPAVSVALALQPDGKAVVAGYVLDGELDGHLALARFNDTGTLDTSFGNAGIVVSPFEIDAYVFGLNRDIRIAIDAGGKIVVTGATPLSSSSSGQDFVVARYNADGSPDNSFDGDGRTTTDFSDLTGATDSNEANDVPDSLLLQPDGRIILGGSNPSGLVMARYNSDGSPDSTFGSNGRAFVATENGPADFGLQPDGKILAAANVFEQSTDSLDIRLDRFNSDGSPDGTFGSGGHALIDFGGDDVVSRLLVQLDGRIVLAGSTNANGSGEDFLLARLQLNGAPDPSFGTNGLITADFSGDDDEAAAVAQHPDGRLIAAGRTNSASFRHSVALLATPRARLSNISTRMHVQTGENVLIGGFIITGTAPKRVLIRGIGPSLGQTVSGPLADPRLELFQGNTPVASNDNWKENEAEVAATGMPPVHNLESAIVRTLAPGAYTAILRGNGNGTGIGVVETYDLDQGANSKLANIATRGFVGTGDNAMMGGFIIGGHQGTGARVVVRALGPSLTAFGVGGALDDPTLEVKDANGSIMASNENWVTSRQEIEATGLAPNDDRESALVTTLPDGAYTAIVRGTNGTTGVAVVEVYNVL